MATVAVGIFSLVTAEQLPVGLLSAVADELRVSKGTAGLMVSVPGVVAAVAAPLLPVAVGRRDRRTVLTGLGALMAAASLASALAPSFALLLASRVLVGVTIGGFWAIAGGIAARLVPAGSVSRATAVIFGGVGAASVLGVPMGTLIGELAGWRAAFLALTGLGLLVLTGLLILLPPLPAAQPVRLKDLARLLRQRAPTVGVIATFFLVAGHFIAYTFISPTLQHISGIAAHLIGPLLLGYGFAGIIGNFFAGPAAGRHPPRALLIIAATLAPAMALMPVLGTHGASGTALLLVWGASFGGVSVSLQTWMLAAAPRAPEAATALYTAMFNLSIALGALAGGTTLDVTGLPTVLWVGAVCVAATIPLIYASRQSRSLAGRVGEAGPGRPTTSHSPRYTKATCPTGKD
ncbi:MFS transporter [Streptomyces sp. NBC_00286]|uniref:MFS transporter n=1 Tax=Streptomyces sp. NBC_00286 TaxID=2975701 RepID=UPI002E2B06D3|nr:MFS transporter [Streptomyces sp. NBC_00286]